MKAIHVIQNKKERIGIPRALLFYEYGVLWQCFFKELGYQVILSPPTDRAIFEIGEAASVDEVCLASKTYMGHVAALLDEDVCDAIFVPSYDSVDVRAGFCTKYQSLPDLVAATFADRAPRLITMRVQRANDRKQTRADFVELGRKLGISSRQTIRAYNKAQRAQIAFNDVLATEQQKTLALLKTYRKTVATDPNHAEQAPVALLLVAHPYIAHDPYIGGDIVSTIEQLGGIVIFADQADHAVSFKRSFEFSETLPWIINRHLAGAIMQLRKEVDGIVLLSAFPCGPDSMFDDAVMRSVKDIPILNLMIDAQNGNAGIETRLESFIDILRFQGRGSYLKGQAIA